MKFALHMGNQLKRHFDTASQSSNWHWKKKIKPWWANSRFWSHRVLQCGHRDGHWGIDCGGRVPTAFHPTRRRRSVFSRRPTSSTTCHVHCAHSPRLFGFHSVQPSPYPPLLQQQSLPPKRQARPCVSDRMKERKDWRVLRATFRWACTMRYGFQRWTSWRVGLRLIRKMRPPRPTVTPGTPPSLHRRESSASFRFRTSRLNLSILKLPPKK